MQSNVTKLLSKNKNELKISFRERTVFQEKFSSSECNSVINSYTKRLLHIFNNTLNASSEISLLPSYIYFSFMVN